MLIPMTAHCQTVVNMFSVLVDIEDVLYVKTAGVDRQKGVTRRQIAAAIDSGDTKRLEHIFGGSVSNGSIGIYTAAELHFVDRQKVEHSPRQSFVTYGGVQYRVTQVSNWKAQTGCYVYLAELHVAQDRL